MSFFKNYSIKGKLLACFMLLLVFSCIVSVLSIRSMYSGISVAENLQFQISVRYARISAAGNSLSAANAALLHYVTPGNQTDTNRASVERSLNTMVERMNSLKALEDQELVQPVEALKANAKRYAELYQRDITTLINAHRPYEALEVYLNVIAPLTNTMQGDMEKLVAFRFQSINQRTDELLQTTGLTVTAVITVVQIILSIVIALLVSGYIARNIKAQCDFADRLAGGDFTYKNNIDAQDEFGTLNHTMEVMRDKLRDTISHVVELSIDVNNSMKKMEQTATEISDAMQSTENQAITVAASADEMVATTANIAKNCTEAAKSSQDSSDLTHQGMEKLNGASRSIFNQYEQMKQSANTVNTLVDQAQKIGSIVGTIDEIAAQTNLLALNAAIEAARAGEAGRGFAVVADEVRALATRTTASTQEIRSMVDRIQAETNIATTAMQNNLDNMSQVADSATAVQETLSTALNFVNEVNTQITQIATAAEEQTSATAEISNNMQNITKSSSYVNDIARNAKDISISTTERLEILINNLQFFKLR